MRFCVPQYRNLAGDGRGLVAVEHNHQTRCVHDLAEPVTTKRLHVELAHPSVNVSAALFAMRVYS